MHDNILLLNILGSIQSTKQRFEGTWVLTISAECPPLSFGSRRFGQSWKMTALFPSQSLSRGRPGQLGGVAAALQGRENPRLPAEQILSVPRLVKTKSVAKPNG